MVIFHSYVKLPEGNLWNIMEHGWSLLQETESCRPGNSWHHHTFRCIDRCSGRSDWGDFHHSCWMLLTGSWKCLSFLDQTRGTCALRLGATQSRLKNAPVYLLTKQCWRARFFWMTKGLEFLTFIVIDVCTWSEISDCWLVGWCSVFCMVKNAALTYWPYWSLKKKSAGGKCQSCHRKDTPSIGRSLERDRHVAGFWSCGWPVVRLSLIFKDAESPRNLEILGKS